MDQDSYQPEPSPGPGPRAWLDRVLAGLAMLVALVILAAAGLGPRWCPGQAPWFGAGLAWLSWGGWPAGLLGLGLLGGLPWWEPRLSARWGRPRAARLVITGALLLYLGAGLVAAWGWGGCP